MPNFNIIKKSELAETFRVSKIMSDFDVKLEHSNEKFVGSIEYPENWQIGIIYGGSGTGKSTIAHELYGDLLKDDFEYKSKSVIDDIPCNNVNEITKMFYAVGFGSVPCWLKPYSALSNGEKMRVDLARKILQNDFIVFDEFTSVVDRQVAKVISISIKKALQKYPNKKFVAISCHDDILEYLQPDWAFNTNDMKQVFQSAHEEKCSLKSENVSVQSGQNLGVIII